MGQNHTKGERAGPGLALGAAAAALGLVAGCASYDPRSSLQIHLTSKAVAGIDAVQLHVREVQVHLAAETTASASATDPAIDGDGAWHSLAVGRNVALLGADGVGRGLGGLRLPEGWIDQVRVTLAAPASAEAKGKTCALDLAALPAKGVKVSQPFRPFAVRHALEHAIWLDLRLDTALSKSGACWALAPQLEVARFTTGGKDVSVQ